MSVDEIRISNAKQVMSLWCDERRPSKKECWLKGRSVSSVLGRDHVFHASTGRLWLSPGAVVSSANPGSSRVVFCHPPSAVTLRGGGHHRSFVPRVRVRQCSGISLPFGCCFPRPSEALGV